MDPEPRTEPAPPASPAFTWHHLLRVAILAIIVLMVAITVGAEGLIPPFIVFFVVFLVGLFLLRRPGKAGVIVLGVGALLFILLSVPFILPSLANPASWYDFLTTALSFTAAVTAIVAAIAALRSGPGAVSDGPRRMAQIAIAIGLLSVVVAIVSVVTFEEAEEGSDDLRLVARSIAWEERELEASSGSVAVFVVNQDALARHTFTIDELDVNLQVPGGTSTRITFEAEPGTYEFYCEPHAEVDEMRGTLTVE